MCHPCCASLPNPIRSLRVCLAAFLLVLLAAISHPLIAAPLTPAQQSALDKISASGADALGRKEFAAAEAIYKQGLGKATALHSDAAIVLFLNALNDACEKQGLYKDSLSYAQQALAIATRRHDAAAADQARLSIGILQRDLERYDDALETLTLVQISAQQRQDQPIIARSVFEMGMVCLFRGKLTDAENYFTQAQDAYKSVPDLSSFQFIAATEYNLGFCYINSGDYGAPTRKLLDDALQSTTKLHYTDGIEKSHLGLGALHWLRGEYPEAKVDFGAAVTEDKVFHSTGNLSWALIGLGMSEAKLGQPEPALQHTLGGLAIFKKLDNKAFLVIAYLVLGIVHAEAGRLGDAQDAFEQSRLYYEELSSGVNDPRDLGGLQDLAQHLYARYASVLISQGQPSAALLMAERGRGQGLARQVKLGAVDLSRFLSPSEAAELKSRAQALTEASSYLHAQAGDGAAPDSLARKRLLDAEQQYALELRILGQNKDNGEFQRLQSFAPPQEAELTALAAKHPDTLYIEWAMVDQKTTLLFALSKDQGVRAFVLPVGEPDLDAAMRLWRDQLGEHETAKRGTEEVPSASKAVDEAPILYQTLLGPLAKDGSLKPGRYAHLVFVPDGPLLDIPFAALADGPDSLLLDHFAVSVSISLGILTWPAPDRHPTASLMCAADPFGAPGVVPRPARRGGVFSPLPNARNEALHVAALFQQPQLLIGSDAREAQVKADMGKYAILHFATHAVPDSENGLLSRLILAPEPASSPDDGQLEAREIVGIPLSAQLAVLSACQTDQGQQQGGEGLLGLVWAFRAAGCPSVVASLWEVEDEATDQLMQNFYQNLKNGADKDSALQAAMLAVRKQHPEPKEWAPFQVIGETNVLPPAIFTTPAGP